jgi:hypothetical protein
MKYRDHIQSRISRGMCLLYGGIALAFLTGIISAVAQIKHPAIHVLFVGGGLVAVLGMIFTLNSIKCPRCDNRIGMTFPNRGMKPLDKNYRYCPYCGCDLNQEINESSNITSGSDPL